MSDICNMRLVIAFVVFAILFKTNPAVSQEYSIVGRVAENMDSQYAYIQIFATSRQPAVFSGTRIKDQAFQFRGNIAKDSGTFRRARLFIHNKGGLQKNDYVSVMQNKKLYYRDLVIEREVFVEMNPDNQQTVVRGGPLNEANNELINLNYRSSVRNDSLKAGYQAAVKKNYGRSSALNSMKGSYNRSLAELQNIHTSELLQLILKRPSSLLTLDQLNNSVLLDAGSRRRFLRDWEDILRVVSKEWLLSQKGKAIAREISFIKSGQRLQKGVPIPHYIFTDERDTLAISELRGNYLLLYFWTSWCYTCRAEQASLRSVYNKFKERGFNILQVSLDSGMENWKKALAKEGVAWKQVRCKNGWDVEVQKTFEISGVPSSYLIDPKGVIIARDLQATDLEKHVDSVIN